MKSNLPYAYATMPLTGIQAISGVVVAHEGSLNFDKQIDITLKRAQTRSRPTVKGRNPERLLTMEQMPKTVVRKQLNIDDFDDKKVTRVQNRARGDYSDQELRDWGYTIVGESFEWTNRPQAVNKILTSFSEMK